MRRLVFLLSIVTALIAATSAAPAQVRITEDRGGQIGRYLQTFAAVKASGERVVVDGDCLSACTLLLGVVPYNRVCATERARFGFHAAWMPDEDGRPVTSQIGTEALWDVYPASVRRWINANGGLNRRMIFLQGAALRGIVQSCEAAQSHASAQPTRIQTPNRGYTARAQ